MRAIFISYRREDTEGQAGRLFDDLVKLLGEQSVFMDVAGIEPGRDFRRAIDEHVASCSVLLALIGKNWIDARNEAGRRRLDDPLDFVRLEIAAALMRDIPVVPVLVRGASMPRADQLPADLADLAFRHAIELTHARWDSDVTVLCKALRRFITPSQPDTKCLRKAAILPAKSAEEDSMRKLRIFLKKAGNRAILSWIGSGIVVATGGLWAVVTYVWPAYHSPTTVCAQHGSISSGRDASGNHITIHHPGPNPGGGGGSSTCVEGAKK